MWAIHWPPWGYKVMAGLNILPFFPLQKTKVGCTIFWYIQWWLSQKLNIPSLLYANTYTFIVLLSLFLFSYCLTSSQPYVYSCCFIMYLFQLSCVSLRMGKNENLLAHYACDSINIIQWHDFFFCSVFFFHRKPSYISSGLAMFRLAVQISSGLAMGTKKQERIKCPIKGAN